MTHEEIQQLEQELAQKQEELREAKSAYQKATYDTLYRQMLALGWKPCETAPRDGTVFLAWGCFGFAKGGIVHEVDMVWASNNYPGDDRWCVRGTGEKQHRRGTGAFRLWLPLPLPTSILASDLV